MFFVFFFPLVPETFRFKAKYHPEECGKRLDESRQGLKKRLSVFLDLLNTTYVENVTVDMDKGPELVRFLDAGQYCQLC